MRFDATKTNYVLKNTYICMCAFVEIYIHIDDLKKNSCPNYK